MGSQKVFFPNARGQTLAGYLEEPPGRGAEAYAVFAHCFTCSKDYKGIFHVSRALAEQGVAVLRFDFTGLGESEGHFSETDLSSNVDDLVCAARFLEGEFAPPGALLGHSLGAVAALRAASRVPSCRAVVAVAPPLEPGRDGFLSEERRLARARGEAEVSIGGRPFRLRREFFEDLARVRVEELAQGLARPLLVFHSPADEVAPVEGALRLFAAARLPKSFVAVDGADHLLSSRSDAGFVGALAAAWLKRYLGEA